MRRSRCPITYEVLDRDEAGLYSAAGLKKLDRNQEAGELVREMGERFPDRDVRIQEKEGL